MFLNKNDFFQKFIYNQRLRILKIWFQIQIEQQLTYKAIANAKI